MRHYVANREAYDHFGFRGYRAAMACLYARPEGASQAEVTEAAAELGSPQKGYYNMLHQAAAWGHRVTVKEQPTRGKIYKLNYEPSHRGPGKVTPPSNWAQLNQTPFAATPLPPRKRQLRRSRFSAASVQHMMDWNGYSKCPYCTFQSGSARFGFQKAILRLPVGGTFSPVGRSRMATRATIPPVVLFRCFLLSTLRLQGSSFMHGDSYMPKKSKRRAWTAADVRSLKAAAKKKTRASSIARSLKRSEGATRQKAFSLGLSLDSRAWELISTFQESPALCGALDFLSAEPGLRAAPVNPILFDACSVQNIKK
jgi:hypothetical protein